LRALLARIPPVMAELDREATVALLEGARRALRRQRIHAFVLSPALVVLAAGAGLLCGLTM
jgi:hypothetical protein